MVIVGDQALRKVRKSTGRVGSRKPTELEGQRASTQGGICMHLSYTGRASWGVIFGTVVLIVAAAVLLAGRGNAASSTGCEGGGYSVLGLRGDQTTSVAAGAVPATFLVQGKYNEFTVVAATFGIQNYTFTGAPNALDMTGGRRTVVFASKTPDHRGLTLTGPASVELSGEGLVISRSGPGLSMKIQANDCASGGIFQMEPSRADGTATRITHTLADGVFYFDNPNFRAREGDVVPFKDTTVTVAPRINLGSDLSPRFAGRDSPQVATRMHPAPTHPCVNVVPAPRRPSGTPTVDHCGAQSVWDVAAAGAWAACSARTPSRSPPSSACPHQCKAQDQVHGAAVFLGLAFPVPPRAASSRGPNRLKGTVPFM